MKYDWNVRLGAVSSIFKLLAHHVRPPASVSSPTNDLPILVALRILMAKSASVLRNPLSDKHSQNSRSVFAYRLIVAVGVCAQG